MTDNIPTVGQAKAATRTYDGTHADLEAILHEWDVTILDEVDPGDHRNPLLGAIDLEKSGLLDALWEWKHAGTETEWGTRAYNRITERVEDVPQPNEASARRRVARESSSSRLISRPSTPWRLAEDSGEN